MSQRLNPLYSSVIYPVLLCALSSCAATKVASGPVPEFYVMQTSGRQDIVAHAATDCVSTYVQFTGRALDPEKVSIWATPALRARPVINGRTWVISGVYDEIRLIRKRSEIRIGGGEALCRAPRSGGGPHHS